MSTNIGSLVGTLKITDEASPVVGKIQAAFGNIKGILSELGGGFATLGNVADSALSGFATGGPMGAALGAGTAALNEMVKGLRWSVEQAKASEQAWTDLQASLKLTGAAWDEAKAKVGEFASALQRTTVFSDEMVVGGIQKLSTFGMSYTQAMDAVKTSIDLAAAKHIDLETAVNLVGKAFIGNTSAMARYGVDLDGIKKSLGEGATDAQVYEAVLARLNTQFGGQAAAQAETYAGTQERLKNAMSELGEKVGGIVLPALASLTEGMIPVITALAEGVVKIQAWISAVSKMPEVKAATDAVSSAFQGLSTWLYQLGTDAATILGPALSDLWDALRELGDALSPIVEAFGELFAAFGAGQGSGSALKDVLWLIALPIKELAVIIKAVAPAIREFADAFKAAADFIAPIIVTIRDTITGALGAIKAAFTDFYNFLIGHSLWTDLWNGMVNVVTAIGPALAAAITGIFTLLNPILQAGILLIQTTMTTGFQLAFATLQTLVQGATDILSQLIGSVQSIIQGTTADWSNLVSAVVLGIPVMKNAIGEFWKWATPFWSDRIAEILQTTKTSMTEISGAVSNAAATMQGTWTSTLSTMASQTRSNFMAIVNEISAAVDAIVARLNAARSQVSKHSIWPDMLSDMVDQTRDAMGLIQDSFASGLQSPGGVIQTIESAQPAMTGVAGFGASSGSPSPQRQTIVNNIYLDGRLIKTYVEELIVEDITLNASRSRRS